MTRHGSVCAHGALLIMKSISCIEDVAALPSSDGGRLHAMDWILVHGLRQLHVDRGGGWFELMTDAIAGRWPAQTPSAGTRRAERGLGISGMPYYFYALRADENFGLVVFLLSEIEGVDWPPDARGATPFDSGGLWFGMIATDPPAWSARLLQGPRRAFGRLAPRVRDVYRHTLQNDCRLRSWRCAGNRYAELRTGYRHGCAERPASMDVGSSRPSPASRSPSRVAGGLHLRGESRSLYRLALGPRPADH